MENVKNKKPHTVYLAAKIVVTGVEGVLTMTEKMVEVSLPDNVLVLYGQGFAPLHLDVDAGELQLSGTVTALKYAKSGDKESVWKKVFR